MFEYPESLFLLVTEKHLTTLKQNNPIGSIENIWKLKNIEGFLLNPSILDISNPIINWLLDSICFSRRKLDSWLLTLGDEGEGDGDGLS